MDKSKKLNFVIMADLSQIGNFSNALYSKIKSVAPVDCVNFEMSDSSCNSRQKVENCDKIFARTSLTVIYGFVRLGRCDNLCACVHTQVQAACTKGIVCIKRLVVWLNLGLGEQCKSTEDFYEKRNDIETEFIFQ